MTRSSLRGRGSRDPARDRVGEPWDLRSETEVFADATPVHDRIERTGALRVRAVGRRLADRGEDGREVRGLVIDHVVDAMRGARCVEYESDGLCDIDVVAERHALRPRKRTH